MSGVGAFEALVLGRGEGSVWVIHLEVVKDGFSISQLLASVIF